VNNSNVALFYILQIGKKVIMFLDRHLKADHPQNLIDFFLVSWSTPPKNSWTFIYKFLSNPVNRERQTTNQRRDVKTFILGRVIDHLWSSKCSVRDGKDTIRPLVRHGVKLTIQLTHCDRFRIDDCIVNTILIHQTLKQNNNNKVKCKNTNYNIY